MYYKCYKASMFAAAQDNMLYSQHEHEFRFTSWFSNDIQGKPGEHEDGLGG